MKILPRSKNKLKDKIKTKSDHYDGEPFGFTGEWVYAGKMTIPDPKIDVYEFNNRKNDQRDDVSRFVCVKLNGGYRELLRRNETIILQRSK